MRVAPAAAARDARFEAELRVEEIIQSAGHRDEVLGQLIGKCASGPFLRR
jgi:hypothetical protein